MSARVSLGGDGLLNWARRAVSALEKRREDLNSLNVFPVPDSDTGSNMAATMTAALQAAEDATDGVPAEELRTRTREVGAALATGALRGARGNSGTVLSQVLRAIADSAQHGDINGADIRDALIQAVNLVDHAIADPVEGTILTVLREAATAADDYGDTDITGVVAAAAQAADDALERTPSQLAALREAGVVDAGGAGLVLLLDALVDEVGAEHLAPPALQSSAALESHGQSGELEVMFFLTATDEEIGQLRQTLETLGDSIVIAGDASGGHMVHIHTCNAGAVIEAGYDVGKLENLRIEILGPAGHSHNPAQNEGQGQGQAQPTREVLALVAPGPLAELMTASGAIAVDPGDNPGAAVTRAMGEAAADTDIVLLPNGLVDSRGLIEIELAAHSAKHSVTVIPTATAANGLAALAVHDASLPLAVDTYAMSEASAGVRTAELSVARGDGLTIAGPCTKGDILAETAGDILVVAPDLTEALRTTADLMLRAGGELVTVLLGDDADPEAAIALRQYLASTTPGVDVSAYAANGIGPLALIGVE
ncbi:DAK2 domain-containing protein [Corynebacterium sp. TAE3-ERU12]|uniref:DAK2 domain-containing protein n=1 Tax=Corynebacterium sp. TAE3-ERU12 TaxID=2849491 RepID=UPI001C437BDC|nr:DAK2 domain-containing protein [Corynebacterium sp. TAE3-ERU12]MBV7295192.1 DAK2 domain-containing protein [Corynebacterium sp. TAE3-ERU12]